MKYIIDPGQMTNMFPVPSSVASKHIKMANEMQLKVLLLFLSDVACADLDVISKSLSISTAKVCEILEYWEQCGVLKNTDAAEKVSKPKATAKKIDKISPDDKPTREEAIRRMGQSEEIRVLFQEAQNRLGRLITQGEMSTLVWLYDSYGLPVSVILTAINYAVREGKARFKYIESVCIDWANNDINTLEKADKRIGEIYLAKSAWSRVESIFGIESRKPSAKEAEYADKWINKYDMSEQLLKIAYNNCMDAIHKLRFAYIDSIIENWYKNGVKSPEDIKNQDDKVPSKAESKPRTSSYDINRIKGKFNNF